MDRFFFRLICPSFLKFGCWKYIQNWSKWWPSQSHSLLDIYLKNRMEICQRPKYWSFCRWKWIINDKTFIVLVVESFHIFNFHTFKVVVVIIHFRRPKLWKCGWWKYHLHFKTSCFAITFVFSDQSAFLFINHGR